MKYKILLAAGILGMFLMVIGAPGGTEAGEITGSITIYGPVSKKVQMISPYARQRYAKSPVSTNEGSETSNVVVYVENPPQKEYTPQSDTVLMDQRDLTFTPHVLPIVAGSTVGFLNSDDVFHNIFSLSKTKKFNLGRYPAGEIQTVTFENPGRVDVFCDIHAAMSAVILIFDHSYFTTADADGNFTISDLPAGEYTVHFWHEDLDNITRDVTVPEDGTITLNAEFRK
ncbi:MAG: carboxypeptidase regulatory-like domain-containing protein [Candidatus Marinimicrobia bacterium]|nr:carboxypeptidase regulatory-like domain-containing protein [Candidatus Neomarinimicrobiota bacterium]MCF7829978.1 carboxypeptidase regulatory-like domain-containing protein [Candidatus Neomarinimicrobiota bacterium]MCF7881868.1 carboxypeptidase regulatory-like domain-containing protein [Candidatus Neomarinimicrobiota bacterium]